MDPVIERDLTVVTAAWYISDPSPKRWNWVASNAHGGTRILQESRPFPSRSLLALRLEQLALI
jgi:hypothetical protein